MTWPAVIVWILIAIGIFSRGSLLLYLFGSLAAFSSLAMVPGELVGGANLLPESICALFLVPKLLLARQNGLAHALHSALDPRKLGILVVFWFYAIVTAFFLPRILAGQVEVIPMGGSAFPEPLSPTLQNFRQAAYITLSTGVAVAFCVAGSRQDFRRTYLRSVLVAGIVVIVTGLLDLFAQSLGGADLLEPFRSATYDLRVDDTLLGQKRVVGLTPEASSYGPLCVRIAAVLALSRYCFETSLRSRAVPAVVVGLMVMAALSTSTTAYVGLAVLAGIYGVAWLRRLLSANAGDRSNAQREFVLLTVCVVAFLGIAAYDSSMFDPVFRMVDQVVFEKTTSESYAERTAWTQAGLDAFASTGGIGVGVGSARTSNWFASILSNTGFVGAVLMTVFLFQTFFRRAPAGNEGSKEMSTGLKFALVPGLVMAALSGTSPDFGVATGAMFGLIFAP